MKGVVKKIIWDRGFGFIAIEDEKDAFFHRSALAGKEFDSLKEGVGVEFDLEHTPKGIQAINVTASDTSKTERVRLMQAYCNKCRVKREMKNPQSIIMKNGRPATRGACSVCGTKMFRVGKG